MRNTFFSCVQTFLYVIPVFFLMFCVLNPIHVSAHEVYVLTPSEIQTAINTPSVSPLSVVEANKVEFSLYVFIGILTVFCLFFISIIRWLEKICDPFLIRLKKYAPFIGRLTIGISFIACAYYRASFGPELPLTATFGHYIPFVVALLYIIGTLIILGLWVRFAAAIGFILFSITAYIC